MFGNISTVNPGQQHSLQQISLTQRKQIHKIHTTLEAVRATSK